jgi:hypothetical protein
MSEDSLQFYCLIHGKFKPKRSIEFSETPAGVPYAISYCPVCKRKCTRFVKRDSVTVNDRSERDTAYEPKKAVKRVKKGGNSIFVKMGELK